MRFAKSLIFCALIIAGIHINGYSQNCVLEVSTFIQNARPGQSDGAITFEINGHKSHESRFIIFDLTATRNGKHEEVILKRNSISELKNGIYEFLIVDKRQSNCKKEIQVEIKERIDEK